MNYPYRIAHVLAPIKSTVTPTNLLFFDTETRDVYRGKNPTKQRHKLWFGYVIAFRFEKGQRTREIRQAFHTADEFWEVLHSRLDPARTLNVYAHNVSFDLTIVDFWKRTDHKHYKIDFAVLEAPPVIISISTKWGRFNVIDTMNYFKTSLKRLGESIGLEKLECDIATCSYEVALPYCKRDTEILAGSMERLIHFVKDNQLGKLGSTVASLALSAFRHRFMTHDIYIHDREKVLQMEQASYHGGMVNCLYVGKVKDKTIYKLDVNSLYPSMMLKQFPVKLLYSLRNPSLKHIQDEQRKLGVIADVLISTNTTTYPYVRDKELLFPTGTYRTVLCTPELQRALTHSHVVKCFDASFYQLAPIFQDYVTYFWNLRKQYKQAKDLANETFCKYMLNSLYGKFAQSRYNWMQLDIDVVERLLATNDDPSVKHYTSPSRLPRIVLGQRYWIPYQSNTTYKVRRVGGAQQIQQKSGWHPESFIAVASFVTSYAREYLQSLIQLAGRNHVYYYDTDSLFVDSIGKRNLTNANVCSETELGKLKQEGKEYEPTFLAPKDYVFGGDLKLKGIRPNAKRVSTNVFEQRQFEGLPSIIKRGGDSYIDIRTITKRVSHTYKKGIITNMGWTKPFHINGKDD